MSTNFTEINIIFFLVKKKAVQQFRDLFILDFGAKEEIGRMN